MKLSQRALAIASSPTLSLNELTKKLKDSGKPVINLGVGEPTNLTPLSAIEKASLRLDTRYIKYSSSSGSPQLKDAVIQYTYDHYGVKPSPKNILISNGAKQAIFNVLYAVLNQGDEVILLAPYWVSYPEMVKMASGFPIIVMPQKETLEPLITDIFSAITTRTKAIILNNPNNPSGVVYSSDLISALVKFCEEKNIFLIMDDIYHKLVFGEKSWTPAYEHTNKQIDDSHIVVINGISKTYGMTGFRIGWAIASADLIRVMANIQSQTTSGVSILLQDAALGALTGPQAEVEELCHTIRSNRHQALNSLQTIPHLRVIEPGGAFYCFPDFSYYLPDSMALSKLLLEKALVAVVPGITFGMEGHLRFSYAGNSKDFVEAVERVRWVLDPESPKQINIGDHLYSRQA